MKRVFIFLLITLLSVSCGEEILTQGTLSEDFTASDLQGFELNTCSQMTFEKPPVDILFVIDNSGSSLLPSFNNIKQQIRNTVNTISNEFDFHIYVAPLIPLQGESLTQYQTVVSDPSTLPNQSSVNIVSIENLSLFATATGNNDEHGISRALDLINGNRTNGIFRQKANTIIVTISNGDDTEAITTVQGNSYFDPNKFNQLKNSVKSLSAKFNPSNSGLQAESLRYITLVSHTNCNGWKPGVIYKKMSNEIYSEMGNTDDPSQRDSKDLCSGNYANLFASINNSIKAVVVGHKYDHWKISNAGPTAIQDDDITVTRVSPSGATQNIQAGTTNGFEYLGYRSGQNTRFEPTIGEPKTGLMIKLNGSAQVSYPDCIIAKTRTPTEYFGYLALPREPQAGSIKVIIRGQEYSQNSTNGWGYIGYLETKNIKVPGPTGASTNPPLNKTGYFVQLFGDAIFTNGDSIEVYYKPASL